MQELWKAIDFGTNYEVSSTGLIRNIKTGKVLSGTINEDGYVRVCLSDGGGHRSFYVQVLVAAAFLGPCPDGLQVRHWDGNPQNNRADNLLYGTGSENIHDAVRHGTHFQARKDCCGVCDLPYDEENTYINPAGSRVCRSCVREKRRRYDREHSEERARKKRERRAAARDPEILTTGEAADLLEVSAETVRRWCRQGRLPFEQAGVEKRVRRADVVKLSER